MYAQQVKTEGNCSEEVTEQVTQHKTDHEPADQFTKTHPASRYEWSGQDQIRNDSPTGNTIQRRYMYTNFGGYGQPVQRESNDTGLPDGLKSGMESVSGYDLGHVKVHYNSAKPAAVQAHTYAQGSDIHLGAGQEKHLPHK